MTKVTLEGTHTPPKTPQASDPEFPPDVGLATLARFTLGRFLRVPATRIFGFDFFISYARHDGGRYASRLHQLLESRSLLTCFDRTDLLPGQPLDDALKRAVARSRYVVLVDTAGARGSRYVGDEIACARASGAVLIRIAAPRDMPLGYSPALTAPERWVLPADVQAFLDEPIRIDEPGTAADIEAGTLAPHVIGDVVANYRRVTTLRRFYVLGTVIAAVLLAFVTGWTVRAWLDLRSRELAVAAADTAADLGALYSQAASLASSAAIASSVPGLLPAELLADMQDSLRAVLRVPLQSMPVDVRDLVQSEPGRRRLVLLPNGRAVFWRSTRGIEGRTLGTTPTDHSLRIPIDEGLIDWNASSDEQTTRVVLAYGDRLTIWTSQRPGTASPGVDCAVPNLQWTRASVTARLALVAGSDALTMIDVDQCRVRWSRTEPVGAWLGTSATGTLVAYDEGSAVHIARGDSGEVIGEPVAHTEPILARNFDPAGHTFAFTDSTAVVVVNDTGMRQRLSHASPVVGVAFSPDGKFLVSTTVRRAQIWSRQGDGTWAEIPETVLDQSWLSKGVAMSGGQLWLMTRPAEDPLRLLSFVFPGGLSRSATTVSLDDMLGLHAQNGTVAVEGETSAAIFRLPPTGSPGIVTLSGYRRDLAAGDWRANARPAECRTKTSVTFSALVCPDLVRIYRLHGANAERWTDLHCASRARGCVVTDAGVVVSDASFSADGSEITLLYAVGERYITMTHALPFAMLRTRLGTLAASPVGAVK